MTEKQIITIEVQDKSGVLTRISSLFSRRGFNIESLTVGHTHKAEISRFTVVSKGDESVLEQIRKQCQKLIHVLTTTKLEPQESIIQEFALFKICCLKSSEESIKNIRACLEIRVLDSKDETLIVECSGSEKKMEETVKILKKAKILEAIHTGKIGMHKGR